jgi:predicted lipoprotein
MRLFLAACLLSATPALADVGAALDDHILPSVDRFAASTAALSEAAQADCRADALRPAYQQAFDAWMGISHLRFGPLEAEGRGLAIAFWPDTRGMVGKTVAGLIAAEDASVADEAAFAEVSVAGRGLFALELLLYDPDLSAYGPGDYSCALARALSADLARMGRDTAADWQGYADLLRTAGQPGNAVFLSEAEATQALYTALMAGLEFTADQRLGRPIGTFDRPRPERAEARRSGRPLQNVTLSLLALRDLARTLATGPIPETEEAFDMALQTAATLGDPLFEGVDTPSGRLRVEILQQKVDFARDAIAAEIGTTLGIAAGFNSLDGD